MTLTNLYARCTFVSLLALAGPATSAIDCRLDANISSKQAHAGPCGFDIKKQSFAGTAAEQAACLTREVRRVAKIGGPTITPFLSTLVGKPGPAPRKVQRLLDRLLVKSDTVGGTLDSVIPADYFIIHDTSSPNCSASEESASCPKRGQLPENRDDPEWKTNKNFGGHPKKGSERKAHVYTNRVGGSITEINLAEPKETTKFEKCHDRAAKTGRFVGIENIQPRVGDPRIPKEGVKANDFDAPIPGFTDKQYERLALIYVVASARRGQWLIPAFHAVLDQYYASGHDDPQHFDMAAFSAAVKKQVDSLATP